MKLIGGITLLNRTKNGPIQSSAAHEYKVAVIKINHGNCLNNMWSFVQIENSINSSTDVQFEHRKTGKQQAGK